ATAFRSEPNIHRAMRSQSATLPPQKVAHCFVSSCEFLHTSTRSRSSLTLTWRTARSGTFRRYRAWRSSPSLVNAPFETRSDRSRVVVAGDEPVIAVLLSCTQADLEPLWALAKHSQQRFRLSFVQLAL